MSTPIVLSSVEQALVTEVMVWLERANLEAKASAEARISPILQERGLQGKQCKLQRIESGWVLIASDGEDTPPINDQ